MTLELIENIKKRQPQYGGYMFVKQLDEKIEKYIHDNNGIIVRKSHTRWEFYIGRIRFVALPLRENSRGYRPKMIFLDERLEDDHVTNVLYPQIYQSILLDIF